MIAIKPGVRLKSAVCHGEVIVIRGSLLAADIRCGGAPMIAAGAAPNAGAVDPAHAGGTLIGKRYVNLSDTVELLCTKGGEGALTLNGELLTVKQAKALPSSD
jgi:hypothetical protein